MGGIIGLTHGNIAISSYTKSAQKAQKINTMVALMVARTGKRWLAYEKVS